LLLIGVLFCPATSGAHRWIPLPIGLSIQPGEFAKIVMIIFMAVTLDKVREKVREAQTLVFVFSVYGVIALFLLKEPDFGMTVLIGIIMMAMLFVAGARISHLMTIVGAGVVGFIGLVAVAPYRVNRILGFLDPIKYADKEGYQTLQSLMAVVSGGFFGKGLGDSVQKVTSLPQQFSDFIMSVTMEEMGVMGLAIVVILYLCFTYRGFRIAFGCDDPLAVYLAFGITFMISMQAFMNIAITLGCLPPKGMTLPFISYGGSSLICVYASIGIVLNISMNKMARSRKRYEESGSGGRRDGGARVPRRGTV
jgi:cell division protein FtsW